MDALNWASARDLREAIGRGDISPVAAVKACLAQIDRLDPELHAFVTVDREGALQAAERAEEAVRCGAALGPLHGIPVAVKDDIWAAGMPATLGSLVFSRFIPSQDGTVVRRLRAAGAIIIGKTNLPEFVSWPRTRSFVAGETLNPWDRTRIP